MNTLDGAKISKGEEIENFEFHFGKSELSRKILPNLPYLQNETNCLHLNFYPKGLFHKPVKGHA